MKNLKFVFTFVAISGISSCDEMEITGVESNLELDQVEITEIIAEHKSAEKLAISYSIYNPYDFSICIPRWNAIETTNVEEHRTTVIPIHNNVNERRGVVEIGPSEQFQRSYFLNPLTIQAPDLVFPEPAFENADAELVRYQENFQRDLRAPLIGHASEFIILCENISERSLYSPPNSPYQSYKDTVPLFIKGTDTTTTFSILD